MNADLKCAYCDKVDVLHRDHVVPRSRGGPDTAANIVMACQPCNSAKGDQLPSEWLGEQCPARVLLIEARVNAKLKSVFKRRDYKGKVESKKPTLYAYEVDECGKVGVCGEVVTESDTTLRIEPAEVLLLWAGLWSLSGELVDVPRSRCRVFNDRDCCLQSLEETHSRWMRSNSVASNRR